MKPPFFSIVIPTRNRPFALEYSVKTILNQTFSDFELIISDNSTNNFTHETIGKFSDPRIKYFRTNGQLSMVDNFEYSLTHVSGKYMLFIGDDDGLLVSALEKVHKQIEQSAPKIITFKWMAYIWPQQLSKTITPNLITIPVNHIREGFIDSKKTLADVLSGKAYYFELPLIYSSLVSVDLIKSVIAGKGRFFHSVMLDVFSGLQLCHLTDNFYQINEILGIRGTCSASNGAVFSDDNEETKLLQHDFKWLNSTSNIQWNEDAPFIMTSIAYCFEAYLQLSKTYDLKIPASRLAMFYIRLIRRAYFDYPEDPERVTRDLTEVQRAVSHSSELPGMYKKSLLMYISRLFKLNNNRKTQSETGEPQKKYGLIGDSLFVDGDKFEITNVLDVQQFVSRLIN